MLQIRDKKAYRKHIETMNPINAKSVQLIELHAFACDLVCIYLSVSFHFLESKRYCGKHSNKYTFYTLRFVCSFAAANTI